MRSGQACTGAVKRAFEGIVSKRKVSTYLFFPGDFELAQNEESAVRGGAAGSGGGLEPMISLAARWFVVCGVLLLPLTSAAALELEVGTRLPTEQNEKIIVKNDGGVQTTAINRLRRATVGTPGRALRG